MIRILIADDHAIVREGMRMLIAQQPDMEVAGTAGNADDAIALANAVKPDVAILDITMPGGGGIPVLDFIRGRHPGTRVLMLSMHKDPAYVRTALSKGASGYLTKTAAHSELAAAIRAVHAGRRYLCSEAATAALPNPVRERSALTPREQQALVLLALGHTNHEVAAQTFVSVKTVESYRARIMAKLDLSTRAEMVQYALRTGLIEMDKLG